MKKQPISLRKTPRTAVIALATLFLLPLYTHAASSSIQDILTNLSFFIKEILIPVLFGIAFLFFLINMTKFFIIGGASEDARAKGKKNVLYSIIAFVFLISIWSIISLLLNGLDIDSDNESLCPDYMESCDDISNGRGSSGGFGSVTLPAGGGSDTSGSGSGSGGSGGNGSGASGSGSGASEGGVTDSEFAGFAELVFGTGKDSALFAYNTGGPRAVSQTPVIEATASCESGLNTLLLANSIETSQAAYALYKDNTGATRWQNLTDVHSTNHITYDKDALDALLNTNVSKVHVIHTHQSSRTENLDLVMEGHGPSAADMQSMCNNDNTSITYATVDWEGIWTMKQQADTCPYSTLAKNKLPLIESYAVLASLEPTTREPELAKYIEAGVTPSQYKTYFETVNAENLISLTPEETLALSGSQQAYASTTVTYQRRVDTFCSTF